MFSIIYLRLEGKVPPLPGIELGSEMSQVSEVNECILQSTSPPPPFQHMMLCLTRKLVSFNFRWIFEICRWKKSDKKYFLTNVRFELGNVPPPPPPQNEKVGFWVKMTFWFSLMYPPPHPQNHKKFFYPKLDLSWLMYPHPKD